MDASSELWGAEALFPKARVSGAEKSFTVLVSGTSCREKRLERLERLERVLTTLPGMAA